MSKTDGTRAEVDRQIELLARRERPRLVAALVSRLGYDDLALAEDVAQDALLRAMGHWPYAGIPENPGAWLQRVSWNRAIDELRRRARWVEDNAPEPASEFDLFMSRIPDPELRLIFLCCHAELVERDQLALTLQVTAGFTAREIASLLLVSEGQVSQRLARLKRRLRSLQQDAVIAPGHDEIEARVRVVVQVIYLMFALGFGPRSGGHVIRADVAREAIRLATDLAACETTSSPEVHALAAVLCLQGSRLEARTSAAGEPVMLSEQDRGLWDRELISRGLFHLMESQRATALSALHLEAGIAACHATAPSWEETDWRRIGWYYEKLRQADTSPVVTMNHAVAVALAGDPAAAGAMVESLSDDARTRGYAPFYIARAEIRKLLGRDVASAEDYRRALTLDLSSPSAERLRQRMAGAQLLG